MSGRALAGRLGAVAQNVRRLRASHGLSLDALADASGVGRATLARLESGQANPTVETLFAIADALGVSLGSLVESDLGSETRVQRASEGVRVSGAVEARLVGRLIGSGLAEILEVRFPADRRRNSKPHPAGVVEHLLVTAGAVQAGPLGETAELGAGDCLRFRGDVPHAYAALGGEARGVVVMSYPPA